MAAEALYLDLLKQCLTYSLWDDTLVSFADYSGRSFLFGGDTLVSVGEQSKPSGLRGSIYRRMTRLLARDGLQIASRRSFDRRAREEGLDWPDHAHTMIGLKRLANLQSCIEDVLRNQVPGDLMETGVWRGGATIFMRAVLKAYGIEDRTVWVADSFEGLPPPDAAYPADTGGRLHEENFLRVSLEQVRANFRAYGLLDDRVRFLKGWFRDTLPSAPVERLAVLRLDGDMYESTMDALENMYGRLSPGGYVIIDDYFLPPCKRAVHEFRERRRVTEPMHSIDRLSVFWQRAPLSKPDA